MRPSMVYGDSKNLNSFTASLHLTVHYKMFPYSHRKLAKYLIGCGYIFMNPYIKSPWLSDLPELYVDLTVDYFK
jgi:hypothetical protein